MIEKTMIVKNSTGLHARPAAVVVSTSAKFKSKITVRKASKEINIKSLIALLSLGVCQNDEIVLSADGPDENEALEAIIEVINGLKD